MNKEEQLLEKRLIELSNLAFSRDIVTFSDFLNLNELNILHRTPKDQFKARFETYGGYELAERQMVAFLPDALCYEYEYCFCKRGDFRLYYEKSHTDQAYNYHRGTQRTFRYFL